MTLSRTPLAPAIEKEEGETETEIAGDVTAHIQDEAEPEETQDQNPEQEICMKELSRQNAPLIMATCGWKGVVHHRLSVPKTDQH